MQFELTKEQYFVRKMSEQFVIDEVGRIGSREDVFRLFIQENKEHEMARQKEFLADMKRRFAPHKPKPLAFPKVPRYEREWPKVHIIPCYESTFSPAELFKMCSIYDGKLIKPMRVIVARGETE